MFIIKTASPTSHLASRLREGLRGATGEARRGAGRPRKLENAPDLVRVSILRSDHVLWKRLKEILGHDNDYEFGHLLLELAEKELDPERLVLKYSCAFTF